MFSYFKQIRHFYGLPGRSDLVGIVFATYRAYLTGADLSMLDNTFFKRLH